MALGMSYDDYWYGDVTMTRYYYEAHQIRLRQRDYESWLAGAYVKVAIESSIGNAFRKGEAAQYPKEPYSVTAEKQKEANEEQQALFMQAWMEQFVEAGKNWGQKS